MKTIEKGDYERHCATCNLTQHCRANGDIAASGYEGPSQVMIASARLIVKDCLDACKPAETTATAEEELFEVIAALSERKVKDELRRRGIMFHEDSRSPHEILFGHLKKLLDAEVV